MVSRSAERSARSLLLGVIGHVDHGKTSLVRALTGTDTDRLPEEKRRGISIELGFAHLAAGPGSSIDLIDMPGHERFVRTLISGATGIDAALLVVAANEGIQAQTIEHVNIASLLGLRRTVVVVTKVDRVAPEQASRVAQDSVRLLRQSQLDPLPAVLTSTVSGTGLDKLRKTLEVLTTTQPPHPSGGLAFLPIDRAFSVVGHGPVVTGTLRGAAIAADDELELLPVGRPVRVRGVQVHGASTPTGLPGQRVALNLRDVQIAELSRGMVLAAPGTLALSRWLTISIRSVESAPALRNGMRLRALFGTSELEARLRLLDGDVLEPGQSGFAQLHCAEPVALPASEHVILRLSSPTQTVAGGRILEPEARRQRRSSAPVLARLEDLRVLPPAAMIAAEVERMGPAGTTLRNLSRLASLTTTRVAELLGTAPVVVARSGLVVTEAVMDDLLARIPSLLTAHPLGRSRSELFSSFTGTARPVFDAALGRLLARRIITERGSQLVIPSPDDDLARARGEAELGLQIAEALRRGGLSPPNPASIVISAQSKRAVERLLRAGVIVRAVDRAKSRQILFHHDAIEEAKRRLAPLLSQGPGLRVSEIAAALGISRKYCMPLLDHLDAVRFTRRLEDRRTRA